VNVSFFQTYGDRLPLLKIRAEDQHFQNFISNFDMNIISLHNPSDEVKNYVLNNKILKNSTLFVFNDNTYCDCIRYLMNFLESKQINKFFFYQDDTFSYEVNENNKNDLKKLVFENEYEMLNLSYKIEYLVEKGKWTEKNKNILCKNDSFSLYDTDTFDFRDSGLWGFDDSCFVCNMDRLKTIFDSNYFNYPDIWNAEHYLKHKFESNKATRYITDVSFFINYNILGRNTQAINLERLKDKIKISDSSLQLLTDYYNSRL
jgi:hypothetical protein